MDFAVLVSAGNSLMRKPHLQSILLEWTGSIILSCTSGLACLVQFASRFTNMPSSLLANDHHRTFRRNVICFSMCFLSVVLSVPGSIIGSVAASDRLASLEVPAERRPYHVRLLVAFDPTSFDSTARQIQLRDIHQTTRRCVGELWAFEATEISWLDPVSEQGLVRLDRSVLEKHRPGDSADVWFVAAIETLPVGKRVSVRSWQPEIQIESIVKSTVVHDERDLTIALIRLCRDLFRPMGIVVQVNDRSVQIRLNGGEYITPDPTFSQLSPDEVLIPMLAYRNKDHVIEKLQVIPWTYLTVDEVDGSRVVGTVQSGLKLALGGKKRGRIDTLVVAVRPQFEATRIQLVTQSKPQLPLVAHRIEVRTEAVIPRVTEEHPEIDPASTLINEKLTDRRGFSKISVEPDYSLVWLFAFSGQHMLARVPFVPGAAAEIRFEVPDDATRLAAEADLQMLQGEVIDAVALRNTAIATIRAAAKKDDWSTVSQKLTLLKQQSSSSSLVDRLIAVRVAGVAAAKANRDKAAETRINRMCDEAVALIKVHLGEEKVRLLTEEMDALQSADVEPK